MNINKKVTKDKIRLLLQILLSAKDENGYVPRSLESYCEMINVTDNITRALSKNNLYSGIGKQKKKILFNDVTDELVELVFKTNSYKLAKVSEPENKDVYSILESQNELIKTMAGQISFLYNELVWKK